MKKIAVGDLGEFWYGDYKEPFVQLEGAVEGYPRGVLLKADDDKLLCPYCGNTFDNLGVHAARTHGLPKRAFKREVGLLQSSALVSEKARQAHIRTALRLKAAGRLHQATGGYKVRPDRLSPNPDERQNKTGRCRAQILAVARQLAAAGRLNQKELRRSGIGESTVEVHFRSIAALRAELGVSATPRQSKWTDQQALDALRNLAREIGRTPSASDLRRVGTISRQVYRTRWGTLGKAIDAAGLPRLPKGGAEPASDVAILSAYALRPNHRDVARILGTGQHSVLRALHRWGFPFPPGSRHDAERSDWAAEMARRLAGESVA